METNAEQKEREIELIKLQHLLIEQRKENNIIR